jgi:hypothetical protein
LSPQHQIAGCFAGPLPYSSQTESIFFSPHPVTGSLKSSEGDLNGGAQAGQLSVEARRRFHKLAGGSFRPARRMQPGPAPSSADP